MYALMIRYCERAIIASSCCHAMMRLGHYYQTIDVKPDKMREYYDMAIRVAPLHQSIYFNYAMYYYRAENDRVRAKELFTIGHELGDIECTNQLGEIAFDEHDESKAHEYYTIASKAGHKEASLSRSLIDHQADKIAGYFFN